MNLTDISTVRELMGDAGTKFKKGFGQNFLINAAVPQRIADSIVRYTSDELKVVEIGPGIGTLTVELSRVADRVVAVEVDCELLPVLDRTLADYDNVTVINADILKTDLAELVEQQLGGGDFDVCANLPYYITSPILMYLLENEPKPRRITVMVQKEVAQRLTAAPGTSEYGAITASVARYGTVTRLFGVPAGDFMPRPKVDSEVIRIDIYRENPYPEADPALLTRVIRGAFAQRRKTLVNSMSGEFPALGKAGVAAILAEMGLPADIRGERLGVGEFAVMSVLVGERLRGK